MIQKLNCKMSVPYPSTEEQYNLIMDIMEKTYKLGIQCDVDFNVYDDNGELIYSETLDPTDLYVLAVNDGIADPFEPKRV